VRQALASRSQPTIAAWLVSRRNNASTSRDCFASLPAARRHPQSLKYMLHISDTRTLQNLICRAGLVASNFPFHVETFLNAQRLLNDPVLINEVLRLFADLA
jgi:hypothetical protein